jgi:hypothetical protein
MPRKRLDQPYFGVIFVTNTSSSGCAAVPSFAFLAALDDRSGFCDSAPLEIARRDK